MNTESINRLPNGLYVLRSEKSRILEQIDSLERDFYRAFSDKQAVAECKACKSRLITLLDEHFADTRVKYKLISRLRNTDTDDINLARKNGQIMQLFLSGLRTVVTYSVPFRDLPSCCSLLDCSVKEAAHKAIDLVGNSIVKASAKALSIGANVYHITQIADIKVYYSDLLSCIQGSDDGSSPTGIELLAENKCKEELEYCKLALLKVSGKLTQGAIDLSRQILDEINKSNEELRLRGAKRQ